MQRVYQEESGHFTHNGKKYDINNLFKLTHEIEVEEFNVSDIEWIINKDEPCYSCRKGPQTWHEERVQNADLKTPIIVTKSNNKFVVLDGVHRLEKAVSLNKDKILGKFIAEDLLE